MTDRPRRSTAGAGDAPAGADGWLAADPASLAPVVLVIGGFITSAGWYGGMARALRERGVADVVVASIRTLDWLLAAFQGVGPLATKSGRALVAASAAAALSPRSRGAPVLLIGHSAGGTLARLLTSPVPFEGRRLDASERIGAIVTLGAPHQVGPDARWGSRIARAGAHFVDLRVPGAFFAPTTGYLAVASSAIPGPLGAEHGVGRFARAVYEDVLPQPKRPVVFGDGIIPVDAAILAGARSVVLPDAVHGPGTRAPWYGNPAQLDEWWPAALEAWRDALAARQRLARQRQSA